MKSGAGFTLIELLVVISIIGLLASVVLIALNGARVKARDVKRAADLKQINTALEFYNDDNGHYPIVSTWACFDCVNYINTTVTTPAAANLFAALSKYMSATPKDPKNLGGDSGYLYYSTDGVNYKLMAWRTPENMNDFNSSLIDTVRCGTVNSSGQCSGNNTVGIWNSAISVAY